MQHILERILERIGKIWKEFWKELERFGKNFGKIWKEFSFLQKQMGSITGSTFFFNFFFLTIKPLILIFFLYYGYVRLIINLILKEIK